jgi:hypothetical protein
MFKSYHRWPTGVEGGTFFWIRGRGRPLKDRREQKSRLGASRPLTLPHNFAKSQMAADDESAAFERPPRADHFGIAPRRFRR